MNDPDEQQEKEKKKNHQVPAIIFNENRGAKFDVVRNGPWNYYFLSWRFLIGCLILRNFPKMYY